MKALRLTLGDQLTHAISSLKGYDKDSDYFMKTPSNVKESFLAASRGLP